MPSVMSSPVDAAAITSAALSKTRSNAVVITNTAPPEMYPRPSADPSQSGALGKTPGRIRTHIRQCVAHTAVSTTEEATREPSYLTPSITSLAMPIRNAEAVARDAIRTTLT